jgi:XTP/dITP diphosphohydrolase
LGERVWVLASSNAGKLAELRALFAGSGMALRSLEELGVGPPKETGVTFIENALLKARHAARRTGLPAIADDSGLVVDALGGQPGVRSARFAGEHATDEDNLGLLLERLAGTPDAERQARFVCVIVALRGPEDPAPAFAQGAWLGSITRASRGRNGFGYDPVFLDPARGLTAAELAPHVKNEISHRALALRALRLDP